MQILAFTGQNYKTQNINRDIKVIDSNSRPSPMQTDEQDEFKKITKGQIKDILKTPQCAKSDCYLVSTIKALSKSGFGKQMLKQSIQSNLDGSEFKVKFNKYNENEYKTIHDTDYTNITGRPEFNATGAVEKSTSSLVSDEISSKPLYLRLFGYSSNLEGNLASCFMKNLTGKEPISIGDKGVLPLSANAEKTTALLDKIGDLPMNKHSFVAGSRLLKTKDGIGTSHYYVVKKVDNKNKTVHLVNPRYVDFSKEGALENFEKTYQMKGLSQKEIDEKKEKIKNSDKVICLDYEKFMKNFRSIVGYCK